MSRPDKRTPAQGLPAWASELVTLYESQACGQFILHGNVHDRMALESGAEAGLGSLNDFLLRALLARFDLIVSYDIGNGIRVEKGESLLENWPSYAAGRSLPKDPRQAVETLTHLFRYTANLAKIGAQRYQVGCIVHSADLVAPAGYGAASFDVSAMASLMREWSEDALLTSHTLATFLITENLNDLHPLIVNGAHAARIRIPLPSQEELAGAFELMKGQYALALKNFEAALPGLAQQLTGATLGSIERLLKTRQHLALPIQPDDVIKLKKEIVESDSSGLIEFIDSTRSLGDFHGQDPVKRWLRQDVELWRNGDIEAIPKGYLLCGPVGTGKTFLIECLAGEAGVPVVKLKNFRDKWVGSTEGNLEKIFRLLAALGRCFVFIDEADQALGRREGGAGDSGVSGRVYSMIAEEMGASSNRGRIIWVLASSRPDLIEVDLKRPGRVDVKIPLFPTTSEAESYDLIKALCLRRGMKIDRKLTGTLKERMPLLLTPGAAEALSVKVYREVKTEKKTPEAALLGCLSDYQNPVPLDVMQFQIEIAAREASDLEFVPHQFRPG